MKEEGLVASEPERLLDGCQEIYSRPVIVENSLPDDLRRVVAAWPRLPQHVRLAIVALAGTVS
jgi:hypothetical protein